MVRMSEDVFIKIVKGQKFYYQGKFKLIWQFSKIELFFKNFNCLLLDIMQVNMMYIQYGGV